MHNFRKLAVYQKSLDLSKTVYNITRTFPSDELFGLTSQLRRATYSIALNIAEGSGMRTGKDFARYLGHALGSGYEAMACLDLARAMGFMDKETFEQLNSKLDEIVAMIVGLQRTVVAERSKPSA